jgi:catechol 2,3-dioxygenase-like lactoylglutathione lyase family enzyme
MRVNAWIVWTSRYDAMVAFYRALGVPLVDEQHDDGPLHAAADVGGIHVAIYPADGTANTAGYRTAGGAMIGFTVASLDETLAVLGATVERPPEDVPWGRRAVVVDPDGRAVEVTEAT